MKKNRGDEPFLSIIHIYIETSHGNSLCSYFKQTKMFPPLSLVPVGEGGKWGKGVGGWIYWKNDTCWNYGWRGDKGEWWKGLIQVWYIWYIVRKFVNASVYPHAAQRLKKTLDTNKVLGITTTMVS
jgi:hypothetical protein